jgi:DNA-nicking Smr family endonuclease
LNSKISDKDKKDWENFLSSNESLPNKELNLKEKKRKKINSFDLHGYSLEDANNKINDLIHTCYKNEVSKLIVVTGKGIHSDNEKNPYISKDLGILKYSVPDYIRRNEQLMSMINKIEDAEIEDGGSGAFYIFFKKKLQNKF